MKAFVKAGYRRREKIMSLRYVRFKDAVPTSAHNEPGSYRRCDSKVNVTE